MSQDEPLLRRSEPGAWLDDEQPRRRYVRPMPPESALCSRCRGAELSCLPAFSVGSGTVFRPLAEDVICLKCGHIGPPDLE